MATAFVQTRSRAAAEVVCLIALVEIIMWAVPFAANRALSYLGMVAMITLLLVTCHLRDGVRGREMGFRIDNFPRVLRAYVLPFGIAIVVLVAVGLAFGSLTIGAKFWGMLATV